MHDGFMATVTYVVLLYSLQLEGTLVVVLFVDSVEEFDRHLSEFLLAIGEALNCIAQFVDLRLVEGQKGTVSKRQSDSPK